MRYAELITLYFERSTAIQNYWTLYVVVIGGLLAVASLRRERDVIAGVLATALFCAFAYKNLSAIREVSVTRAQTLEVIRQYNASASGRAQETTEVAAMRGAVEPTLGVPDLDSVRNFHVGCAAVTVITMWALQWRRKPAARSAG